jgi:hypothetical protein
MQRNDIADLVTLAELRTEMLDVACSRCARRGRYRVVGLVECYGRAAAVRAIVPACYANDATCCFHCRRGCL